jgi:hypothetical protein
MNWMWWTIIPFVLSHSRKNCWLKINTEDINWMVK